MNFEIYAEIKFEMLEGKENQQGRPFAPHLYYKYFSTIQIFLNNTGIRLVPHGIAG
jgi:hypothetical protein